jgi:Fe2+ transport system protein B
LIVHHEEENADEEKYHRPITVLSTGSASIHPEKLLQSSDKKDKRSTKRRLVQFLARVVLPVFTAIFIFSYIMVCMYDYNNPILEYD